jgi:hypothetical protein
MFLMNSEPERDMNQLCIWQQNLKKSSIAQQDLLVTVGADLYDIVTIQEPYIDWLKKTQANHHWHVIYPTEHHNKESTPRAVILINSRIKTDTYEPLAIDSNDIAALRIQMSRGNINIFNIYNDCGHLQALKAMERFMGEWARGK